MKNDMMLSILVCDDDKYFFEILRDCLCKNMYFNKSDFLYSGNKEDMLKEEQKDSLVEDNNNAVYVSALQKTHIQELKEKLAKQIKTENQTLQLVGDLSAIY